MAAKGWKFGNAKDFLRLSEEEAAYIELKIRLAEALRHVNTLRFPRAVPARKLIIQQIDEGMHRRALINTKNFM